MNTSKQQVKDNIYKIAEKIFKETDKNKFDEGTSQSASFVMGSNDFYTRLLKELNK